MLKIHNLEVQNMEAKTIIANVNLKLEKGQIYGLVGANGSGKTSLARAIMGDQELVVKKGQIEFLLENKNKYQQITNLNSSQRAVLGIFISYQHPVEIKSVSTLSFLKEAKNSLLINRGKTKLTASQILKEVEALIKKLDLPQDYLQRGLNHELSGGQKKRSEILQMLFFNPRLIILDEIDSGLDKSGLKIICNLIKDFMNEDKTLLIISHQQQIFEYLQPVKIYEMEQICR